METYNHPIKPCASEKLRADRQSEVLVEIC